MIARARRRRDLAALGVAALTLLAGCFGPVERPSADFGWCPDGTSGALDYAFTPTSVPARGQDIVRAVWEFGDGTAAVETQGAVSHRFAEPGSYAVVLTVTDRRGVAGTETKVVPVEFAAFIDPTWTLTLGYPPTVTGVVGNRVGVRLEEVVVRVRFCDADGVRLGDERLTLYDLSPGEHVRFEIETWDFMARVFLATVDVESFVAACVVAGN
jgi:hypothetical protein